MLFFQGFFKAYTSREEYGIARSQISSERSATIESSGDSELPVVLIFISCSGWEALPTAVNKIRDGRSRMVAGTYPRQ